LAKFNALGKFYMLKQGSQISPFGQKIPLLNFFSRKVILATELAFSIFSVLSSFFLILVVPVMSSDFESEKPIPAKKSRHSELRPSEAFKQEYARYELFNLENFPQFENPSGNPVLKHSARSKHNLIVLL
jgi:hypothetical protein